jgi:hypothetical protein
MNYLSLKPINKENKMIKTKLDLIKDIEAFIETNLEKAGNGISSGQNRIDWKEDSTIVFDIENMLQNVIVKLQTIKLEDIK